MSQGGRAVKRGTLTAGPTFVPAFNSLKRSQRTTLPLPHPQHCPGKAQPAIPVVSSDSKSDLDPALSLTIKGTIITTFSECFEVCQACLGPQNQTQLLRFLPSRPNFLPFNRFLSVTKCLSLSLTPFSAHFLAWLLPPEMGLPFLSLLP